MKYAIYFSRKSKFVSTVDEIIIKYAEKDAELIKYAQSLPEEQRLIVNITSAENDILEKSLDIIKTAFEVHPNFSVLTSKNHGYLELAENDIPFFFYEGATCLDDIVAYKTIGVSDIYILNELGFRIPSFAASCHAEGIKLRVYPNIAQTGTKFHNAIPALSQFFIRPEAVKLYEEYIDVLEIYDPSLERQDVLLKIYQDGHWDGNLEDIIGDLGTRIDNTTIVPQFDSCRLRCEKRCALLDTYCSICPSAIAEISRTLKEKHIGIKKRV